jgi:hypothetical protein
MCQKLFIILLAGIGDQKQYALRHICRHRILQRNNEKKEHIIII